MALELIGALWGADPPPARCGTGATRVEESIYLSRRGAGRRALAAETLPAARADIGEIAILDGSGGVVGLTNPFDLEGRGLEFTPAGGGYRIAPQTASLEAGDGIRLPLGDDDTRPVTLPFEFPFYGARYRVVHVNSDGNLTFGAGDGETAGRTLGRLAAGLPRIAGFYRDLDPSRAGTVTAALSADRATISWTGVPDYRSSGIGPLQTFQIRLHADGRIAFAYQTARTDEAVVGVGPGGGRSLDVVRLADSGSGIYPGAVAEGFRIFPTIDVVRASQRFYETHGDSYDYLIFFNTLGISADGAVAFQLPVRVAGAGYGLTPVDFGVEFGSRRRLQSVLNLGPLSQYPLDPYARVPSRFTTGDTTMSVLAHEMGHQYLAYASVRDGSARPMLGRDAAHWSFLFNSEASVMEGNRIADRGPGVSPRFETVATVEGFAPLDQYLMGWRAADEVPPSFYVTGSGLPNPSTAPLVGQRFDGERRDVRVSEVVAAAGVRSPGEDIAQRRYRVAFVLVTGTDGPTTAQWGQLDAYRRELPGYFERISGGRAAVETETKLALHLSLAPGAELVAGAYGVATVELDEALPFPLRVALWADNANVALPREIEIAAGRTRAEFYFYGWRAGLDTVRATPGNRDFETAVARVRVR